MATKTTTIGNATRTKRPRATTTKVQQASVPVAGDTSKGGKGRLNIPQRNGKACSISTKGAAGAGSTLEKSMNSKQTPQTEKEIIGKLAPVSSGENVSNTVTSKSTKATQPTAVSTASSHKDPSRGRQKNSECAVQDTPPPGRTTIAKQAQTTGSTGAKGVASPSGSGTTSTITSAAKSTATPSAKITTTPSAKSTTAPSAKSATAPSTTEATVAATQERSVHADMLPVRRLPYRCRPWDARGECPKGDACPRRHSKRPPSDKSTGAGAQEGAIDAQKDASGDQDVVSEAATPLPPQVPPVKQAKLNIQEKTKFPSEEVQEHLAKPQHDESKQSTDASEVASPTAKNVEICLLYLNRRCFYGSRCRFLHVRQESLRSGAISRSAKPSHDSPSSDDTTVAGADQEALTTTTSSAPSEKAPEQANVSLSSQRMKETASSQVVVPSAAVEPATKEWNPGITDLPPETGFESRVENQPRRPLVSRLVDSRPARFVNEVCGYFLKGDCEYGDGCIFTHTRCRDKRPARETREICRAYLRGECVHHARCVYYHIDVEASAPAASSSDTAMAEPSSQSSLVEETLPGTVADNGSCHRELLTRIPSMEPPRYISAEEQVDHRPARILNAVCQAYHRHGRCRNGDNCYRTHVLPEQCRPPTNAQQPKGCSSVSEPAAQPELPKMKARESQPPMSADSRSVQDAVLRRPLAAIPGTPSNLPSSSISGQRTQNGKGTTANDLLASIRAVPAGAQVDEHEFERSIGDMLSTLPGMRDSTVPVVRLPRSYGLNERGEYGKGKKVDTTPSNLRDATFDDPWDALPPSPSSAHLMRLFFGDKSGARRPNVGPRFRSLANERPMTDRSSSGHPGCPPRPFERVPSDSSSLSYDTEGSVSKISPDSSISSTAFSTPPKPTAPSNANIPPRTDRAPNSKSSQRRGSDKREAHLRNGATEGTMEHTQLPPLSKRTRFDQGTAAPLIGPSRQVNVPENTTHARKTPKAESAPEPRLEVPLVPPGLGLEDKTTSASSTTSRTEAPAPRRELTSITLTILNATRVTYGHGFEICSVVTGFEPRQIVLSNLPRKISPAEITAALQPVGEVTAVYVSSSDNECKRGTALARVTFATPEQALQAVASLDDTQLFHHTVGARLLTGRDSIPGKGRLTDGDVLLEFPCPYKIAYVGYPSRAIAQEAIAKANGTELRGNWITAQIHQGLPSVGSCTVQLWGLPVDTEVKDLHRYGKHEGAMFQRPNYTSLRSAIDRLRDKLENSGDLLSFDVLPPPYKRCTVRALAHFDSAAAARRVCANFHKTVQPFCGHGTLYAKHVPMLIYTLPCGVFDALATDIRLLNSYVWRTFDSGSSISVVDRRTSPNPTLPVSVKLASQDMQSLTRMKTHFEQLLRGEKVVQDGEIVWDTFFGRAGGIRYLEELERRYPGVLVNKDYRRRTLALFGPAGKRDAVRSDILSKIAELRKQKTHVVPLPGRVIGLFLDSDLVALQQQYGRDNVELDPWARVLKIRGEDDAYEAALLVVKKARDRHSGERRRHEVECPVCFNEVTSPVKLDCGHTWCKSCLQRYLRASVETKTFPLSCLGDEARCSHRIPIGVAQDILSPSDFEDVVHASFRAYVHSRPMEYHYCPTPDCPQVYRVGSDNSVLQCPSCLIRICPKCHSEYHEGRDCQYNETVSQMLFEQWKGSHDVKDCPKCKTAIEREAGCNHMTCTRCKIHICWACLATFDAGGEVYEHMRLIHGGIGL